MERSTVSLQSKADFFEKRSKTNLNNKQTNMVSRSLVSSDFPNPNLRIMKLQRSTMLQSDSSRPEFSDFR